MVTARRHGQAQAHQPTPTRLSGEHAQRGCVDHSSANKKYTYKVTVLNAQIQSMGTLYSTQLIRQPAMSLATSVCSSCDTEESAYVCWYRTGRTHETELKLPLLLFFFLLHTFFLA